MLKLSKENQKTIEMQMYNKARDIDVAVFNCMTRPDFPKMFFSTALSGFQNRDGGFGHALEIDNYNKESSVIQILEAFRLSRLAGASFKDDTFLADTFKKVGNYLYNRLTSWDAVIPSNNNAICASWYKYNDVNIKRFGDAPKPELVGYTLYFYDETSPYYKKAFKMADEVINKFLNKNEFTDEELISYAAFVNLLKEKNLFSDKNLLNHLIEVSKDVISNDDYSKYRIMPIDVFYDYTGNKEVDDAIDKNLDYILSSIKSHGLWEANFDWSQEIAEGSTAQIKWIGRISCKYLYILKKFNRIEE